MKHFLLKPTLFVVIILLLILMIGLSCNKEPLLYSAAKLYVACEESGSISVIDLHNNSTANLSLANSSGVKYKPHNVQVAPDGKSVWASAVPVDTTEQEQLIVIDPKTGTIKKRISIGKNLDLVHVVLDNESQNAFVTASAGNKVIQTDATTYKVVRSFPLGLDNAPHGMRYSHGKLYVANMGSKSMSIINVADGSVNEVLLGGMAVQVAVTRDEKFIFASLYDTREVVRYDLKTKYLTRIQLPEGSQGPIQLYATPDSKLLYTADQGELMKRPVSDKVYVIDIANAKVIHTITTGQKAHGVVVSRDGKTTYVTNSLANTVSIIDVATQKVTATVPVGEGPNGISYWFETGGMP
jgi:YVTN family beta-propeller protein